MDGTSGYIYQNKQHFHCCLDEDSKNGFYRRDPFINGHLQMHRFNVVDGEKRDSRRFNGVIIDPGTPRD